MIDNNVDVEIDEFLNGKTDTSFKNVVSIEADNYRNNADLVVHDKETGEKRLLVVNFTPFLYMKDLTPQLRSIFYNNDSELKSVSMSENGISIKKLHTKNAKGDDVERLVNGYKYLVTSSKSFNNIIQFFKRGGIDIYKDENRKMFYAVKAYEQVMIQHNIKLFYGYDEYKTVHKLYFDIETTGLDPYKERCFMIGVKDTKGYQRVLVVDKEDDNQSEIDIILEFFNIIKELKPAIISGYNSENFDFYFMLKRLELMGVSIDSINISLKDKYKIKRVPASLKLGGETEVYNQTQIFGYNIIDIYHAVRRAKAINSDIKEAGLKYITKYIDKNKPNRMYINNGFNIYRMWKNNDLYVINPSNNEYDILPTEYRKSQIDELKEDDTFLNLDWYKQKIEAGFTKFITGSKIVEQYLLDDLWETEQVDNHFNESTFMVAKWLPTNFNRSATIGGASSWNLIMTHWSYNNQLAIPRQTTKRNFVGGISRTFRLGKLGKIVKADYAGLYPSIQLEYNVFPTTDVTGVLYRLLLYFKTTRDTFKKLAKDLEKTDPVSAKFYETKQLPLKIFNNSNFGANGSEFFFWSDMDVAERITCTGRQYLRKLVKYFVYFDFKPCVLDTDGVNYLVPELITKDLTTLKSIEPIPIEDVRWTDKEGKTHTGLDAFFQKFNKEVLDAKYMKVDNDGMWVGGINIARKNYVSHEVKEKNGVIKDKLKFVGNTIKSTNLPKYVESFLNTGLTMLIKNQGKEFIDLYNEVAEKVFYKQMISLQLASKAKVKKSLESYYREIYFPNLLKDIFGFKIYKGDEDISVDDQEIDDNFEEELSTEDEDIKFETIEYIPDIDGEDVVEVEETFKTKQKAKKETAKKVVLKPYDNFLEHHKKVVKSKKIAKLKFEQMQEKINFAISKDMHKNDKLPTILKGDNFVTLFGNNFMDGLNHLLEKEFTSEEQYNKFYNVLLTYFKIYGNKNGQPKSKQIHMELLIKENKSFDLGDTIYFVNNGLKKSHGDSGIDKNGQFYARLVNEDEYDKVVPYNIEKYMNNFNKRIEPLLICFKPEVKTTLLILDPSQKTYYTDEQCELVNYDYNTYPYDDKDKALDDLYVDTKNVALFKMENREVYFWNKNNIDPRVIFDKIETDVKLNNIEYYEKYKKVKTDYKKHGVNILDINRKHHDGDIVLVYQNEKYYLAIYNNNEYVIDREV